MMPHMPFVQKSQSIASWYHMMEGGSSHVKFKLAYESGSIGIQVGPGNLNIDWVVKRPHLPSRTPGRVQVRTWVSSVVSGST